MGKTCGRLRLLIEAANEPFVRCVMSAQHLDRDAPAKQRIRSAVHHCHAAFAQLGVQAIAVVEDVLLLDQDAVFCKAMLRTFLAMGNATAAPYPAFSTTTATTTRGFSAGAKQTNHECAAPSGLVAVPVLPATVTPGSCAPVPVP